MAKLTVNKKGFTRKGFERKAFKRKGYVRSDGTRVKSASVPKSKISPTKVKPSTFKIKDRGAKGRGKKVIPKLKKGFLNVSFSSPANVRRAKLVKLAKKQGEKKVVGKLRALQVLNKRTNPTVSRKALADSKFIAGSFKGKKRVQFPSGYGRSKK